MTTKLTSTQFMMGLQHFDAPKYKNLIRKGDEFKFNTFTNKKGKLYKIGLNRVQTRDDMWAMQGDYVPYYLASGKRVQWTTYGDLYKKYINDEITIEYIE